MLRRRHTAGAAEEEVEEDGGGGVECIVQPVSRNALAQEQMRAQKNAEYVKLKKPQKKTQVGEMLLPF